MEGSKVRWAKWCMMVNCDIKCADVGFLVVDMDHDLRESKMEDNLLRIMGER